MENEFKKLLEKIQTENPEFKTRIINEKEQYFINKFKDDNHFRIGFILSLHNKRRLLFMSLPLSQLLVEINESNIDKNFLLYNALLIDEK